MLRADRLPDTRSTKEFAHQKETKAPEGATAGGTAGGALGVLAGIGALAIPGIGPLIAAGPIVAGLAGLESVGQWRGRHSLERGGERRPRSAAAPAGGRGPALRSSW